MIRRHTILLAVGLALVGDLGLLGGVVWGVRWYFDPAVELEVVERYGEREGEPLTLKVIRPEEANGAAVVLMVSGSWKSGMEKFQPWMTAILLRRGFTVVAVTHVSQPEASVMEIVEDVNRAVRFVRYHADEYGIDPERIGVTGGSSGGHLSLMLATRGGAGEADAEDPVDRESSAVQAAAIFFPVTDLINLGRSNQNLGDGGPPKNYRNAFGPRAAEDVEAWRKIGREISPLHHVTAELPPVLILHGDADTLVPLEQSEWFRDRAEVVGAEVELRVYPDRQHGWVTMIWDTRAMAAWFEEHLPARHPLHAEAR